MNKARKQLSRAIVSLIFIVWTVFAAGCGGSGISNSPPAISPSGPVAAFSVSTSTGSYPLSVAFDATASSDSNGTIARYDWQFGDGSTGIGSIIRHTYTTPGTYTARLTVLDNHSDTGTHSTTIEVKPRYTLSGTVLSAGYVQTDGDVNDSNATYTPNDSFGEAQAVSVPASISGYVNLAGSGSPGRSFSSGDMDDYYTATIAGGTDITLFMAADPSVSELNLYLYEGDTQIDSTFTDANGTASLRVPQDGAYFIRVEAADYASLTTATVYVLNIGKTSAAVAGRAPRLSDDFVPGEVLVRLENGSPALSSAASAGFERLSAMGLSTSSGTTVQDKLWRISSRVDSHAVLRGLGVQSALDRSLAAGHTDAQKISRLETLWMVRALRKTEGVRLAEPNYIRKRFIVEPNDTYYPYQWHFPLIGLPEAWGVTTGSSDVVVADLDTGILKEHPDLQGQLVDGYDFVSDPSTSLDGDGVDPDPEDPGDGEIGGSTFHGTHTAGTIAAHTNNSIGVAGIAWNAKIMPLRVLGYLGSGTSYDILQAVRYAAGMSTDAGVQLAKAVDVINLSLGGPGYSTIEEQEFQEAHNRGAIIVASAGNDGNNTVNYPAGYDGVVSVSAVTIEGKPADYSNFGPTIDVAAPGGASTDLNGDGYVDGILSTSGDDSSGTVKMGYAFYTGTSMAAPHVSGVAALMKSLYPGMTPAEFDSLLAAGDLTQSSDTTLPDDHLGYGIIDAYKATLVAQEAALNGEIPPILSVAPRVLNLGVTLSSLSLTVGNGGSGTLNVDSYESDASWLSVSPSSDVDGSGLGTYTVDVTREGLAEGTYSGSITFTAGTQQVRISVIMQVGPDTAMAGGGYYYILLLDADTRSTVKEFKSAGNNGSYAYNFTGIPYGGTYMIYAGTDPDNDSFICTAGESCGAYLSLDKPVVLTIQNNIENIDFKTDININIPVTKTGLSSETGGPLQRSTTKSLLRQ